MNPNQDKIIGIYGDKNSLIINSGGKISIGNGGIAFYGNKSEIRLTGGVFQVDRYAER